MPVRIPKRVWAKHRALIELLYQSNPLLEVIRIMAEEHGFEAEYAIGLRAHAGGSPADRK